MEGLPAKGMLPGAGKADRVKLEEVLVAEAGIDREVFRRCQALSERNRKSIVEVLVDTHVITEEAFARIVARRVGTMVIDVERGALDSDSVKLLPEDVCRRFAMIAVSSDAASGTLRVVFANPLDEGAIRSVRDLTGLQAEPLVASLSDVREAIDREFARRTKVTSQKPPPPLEIPMEVTRKVNPGEAPVVTETDPGTAPVIRLEQTSTIEQRHEALLLALIDAGVITRSDYVAALHRLLGKAPI